ncbi:hypothetical protein [Moorena producens]|uniref:hypothetical protein n=1 Tax=Moorena producens TaxID=1155739 RepID=UPI003C76AC69
MAKRPRYANNIPTFNLQYPNLQHTNLKPWPKGHATRTTSQPWPKINATRTTFQASKFLILHS